MFIKIITLADEKKDMLQPKKFLNYFRHVACLKFYRRFGQVTCLKYHACNVTISFQHTSSLLGTFSHTACNDFLTPSGKIYQTIPDRV